MCNANAIDRPASVRPNQSNGFEDTGNLGGLYADANLDAGDAALRLGFSATDKFTRDPSEGYGYRA